MSTLRITAGSLRGRRVAVPPGGVRPTSERARQAYFNIVGPMIGGSRFLDLFAGSGIFSFEALSRGATSATAVDHDRRQCLGITRQSETLGVNVRTLCGDVPTLLAAMTEPCDLVYADPPYRYGPYRELIASIGGLALSAGAIVAVEHRRGSDPFSPSRTEDGLRIWRRAEYGEVWITFFRPAEAAATDLATNDR